MAEPVEPGNGGSARGPAVIRTGGWPLGGPTERAGDQLARLVHDLRNLIDGSHRQVNLALRSVRDASAMASEQDELERRLRTVRTALEQMAALAAEATGRREAARQAVSSRRTMAEAIRHAAWILEPKAAKHGVRVEVELDPAFDGVHAGAMYTVVLNGVQNAVESIRAAGRGAGRVRVVGTVQRVAWAERLCVEVIDDGEGPRAGVDYFAHGATSRKGHLGIGLSMAAEAVLEADGMITLEARRDGPGAVLRVVLPRKIEEGSGA